MTIPSSKRIEESRVQTIFAQLVLALHHCHHAYLGGWTLLHRDIKPENGEFISLVLSMHAHLPSRTTVLFTSEGKVKLADFGLSRFLGGDERQAFSFAGVSGNQVSNIRLLLIVNLPQTPGYFAPVRDHGIYDRQSRLNRIGNTLREAIRCQSGYV